MPEGDWETLLSDQFEGEILDGGNEFQYMYPSQLNPIMLTGVIESSFPLPPIRTTSKACV